MKTNGHNRGSVLMEFIIVFPIYLILFAGTVAIGDMMIHSNRLVSADRIAAFGVEGWASSGWSRVVGSLFHPGLERADDGTAQDALTPSRRGHYADSTGPWTVSAAATAVDGYRPLAGGTLGQLLGAHVLLGGNSTGTLSSELQTWADGNRVALRSKGTDVRDCHYVLKRRRGASSWRTMIAGLLLNDWWLNEVANEMPFTDLSIENGPQTCSPARSADIPGYGLYSWPDGWRD